MKISSLDLVDQNPERLQLLGDLEWHGVGNVSLLNERLVGLIASRQCPGSILLDTLEHVPDWANERRVILSGFHSPLEQQVLRSLLRRNGRVVKLLARSISTYQAPAEEREALDDGRMFVLTPFPPEVCRTTRATALERNRLILALASEIVVPHISKGSPLAEIIADHKADAPIVRIRK